jgi:hypothetical protein
MSTLQPWAKYIVYTNIFVAGCTAALVAASAIILGITVPEVTWFTGAATLAAYNFMRLFQLFDNQSFSGAPLHVWIAERRWMIVLLTLISSATALYFFLQFETITRYFVIPLAILSGFYSLRIPLTGGSRLREIPGLKIFLISTLWALVTVSLPAVEAGVFGNTQVALLTLERFLFIFAITLPFDIRDLPYDPPSLNTLPQRFGVAGAKGIALFAILFLDIVLIAEWRIGYYELKELIALIAIAETAAVLVFFANEERTDAYFTVLIESLSFLLFVVIWAVQYL